MEEALKKCYAFYKTCPKLGDNELEQLLMDKNRANTELYTNGFIAKEFSFILELYNANKSLFSDLYTFEDFFYDAIYIIIDVYNTCALKGRNILASNITIFRQRLTNLLNDKKALASYQSSSPLDLVYETFEDDITESIDKERLFSKIVHIIDSFDSKYQRAFYLYFGLDGTKPKSQAMIAKELGFSKSYICFLIKRGIRMIKIQLNQPKKVIITEKINELFNAIFEKNIPDDLDKSTLYRYIIHILEDDYFNGTHCTHRNVICSYYGIKGFPSTIDLGLFRYLDEGIALLREKVLSEGMSILRGKKSLEKKSDGEMELFRALFGNSIESTVESNVEIFDSINSIVDTLDDRYKKIIYEYYGLNGHPCIRIDEIAKELRISHDDIFKIKENILKILRDYVKKEKRHQHQNQLRKRNKIISVLRSKL